MGLLARFPCLVEKTVQEICRPNKDEVSRFGRFRPIKTTVMVGRNHMLFFVQPNERRVWVEDMARKEVRNVYKVLDFC
jgi:hypothetical protein